jgi:bifunctional ADP-heptose synthase (sugar kinase/adenylyltransferase)
VKTRILGGGAHASKQQMVRIDKITHLTERDAAHRRVMRALRGLRGRVDGVLVSDYGFGLVNAAAVEAAGVLRAAAAASPSPWTRAMPCCASAA